jgi:Raf kinase inhibitor-like YbhB/YbcL family protein
LSLSLISSDFSDGAEIPRQYTRLGQNASPPLEWSDPPEGTLSYALVVEDPDAPNGVFRHWAIYDMPASKQGLRAGEAERTACPQARNDFGETGYGGPEPPAGHGPHRYRFRLLALPVPSLDVPEDPDVASVLAAAEAQAIGAAELVGRFERGSKDM